MEKMIGEPGSPGTWETDHEVDGPTWINEPGRVSYVQLPPGWTIEPCTINGIPADQLPDYIPPIKKSVFKSLMDRIVNLFHT